MKLILVDPKTSEKTKLSINDNNSENSSSSAHQKRVIAQSKKVDHFPLVLHSFKGNRIEKVILGKKIVPKRKKNQQSRHQELVIKTDPKYTITEEQQQLEHKTRLNTRPVSSKPFSFVADGPTEYSLEYANAWQSSLDFNGKGPSRPLFKITSSSKAKHKGSKDDSDKPMIQPFRSIHPDFSFNYNSFGRIKTNSNPASAAEDYSKCIFKINLKRPKR